jgi:hypothetical protein
MADRSSRLLRVGPWPHDGDGVRDGGPQGGGPVPHTDVGQRPPPGGGGCRME